MTEAVIKDNKIFCGKCGHIIAKCKELRLYLGHGEIYMPCNHRDSTKTPQRCGEVNKITL